MAQREDWGEKRQGGQCRWKAGETWTIVDGNGQTQKMSRTNGLATVLLRVRPRGKEDMWADSQVSGSGIGESCFPGSEPQPHKAGMTGNT